MIFLRINLKYGFVSYLIDIYCMMIALQLIPFRPRILRIFAIRCGEWIVYRTKYIQDKGTDFKWDALDRHVCLCLWTFHRELRTLLVSVAWIALIRICTYFVCIIPNRRIFMDVANTFEQNLLLSGSGSFCTILWIFYRILRLLSKRS